MKWNERVGHSAKDELFEACRRALDIHCFFENEAHFGAAVAEILGKDDCLAERPIVGFEAPFYPPPQPPPNIVFAGDVCDTRRKQNRRLDLLWLSRHGKIAVEWKYQRRRGWEGVFDGDRSVADAGWADTNGYHFLKDVYRLERLIKVTTPEGRVSPERRFAAFLTNESKDFDGEIVHERIRLKNGDAIQPGHLVQFNMHRADGRPTSPNTLWRDYPPFFLANEYKLNWIDLSDDVSKFIPSTPQLPRYP